MDKRIQEEDRNKIFDDLNNLMKVLLNEEEEKHLKSVLLMIDKYVRFYPQILLRISENLIEYRKKCKRENDSDLRECLGDALTLLSMDRKPSKKFLKEKYLLRIKNILFNKGLTEEGRFHQGEKDFYNKFLKD